MIPARARSRPPTFAAAAALALALAPSALAHESAPSSTPSRQPAPPARAQSAPATITRLHACAGSGVTMVRLSNGVTAHVRPMTPSSGSARLAVACLVALPPPALGAPDADAAIFEATAQAAARAWVRPSLPDAPPGVSGQRVWVERVPEGLLLWASAQLADPPQPLVPPDHVAPDPADLPRHPNPEAADALAASLLNSLGRMLAEPRVDDNALAAFITLSRQRAERARDRDNPSASPDRAVARVLSAVFASRGLDERLSPQRLDAVTAARVSSWLRPVVLGAAAAPQPAADVPAPDSPGSVVEAALRSLTPLEAAPIEIAIAGPVTLRPTVEAIAASFGALPRRATAAHAARSAPAVDPRSAADLFAARARAAEFRGPSAVVLVGMPAPDLKHLDDWRTIQVAGRLLNNRLADDDALPTTPDSSRPNVAVIPQRGIAEPGLVLAYARVDVASPVKPLAAELTLRRLAEAFDALASTPVDQAELARVTDRFAAEARARLDDPQYWAGILARSGTLGLTPDALARAHAAYTLLTPDSVREVWARHWRPPATPSAPSPRPFQLILRPKPDAEPWPAAPEARNP